MVRAMDSQSKWPSTGLLTIHLI